MKKHLNQVFGFTLMEVLVAVTIVGISFAVIAQSYLSLTRLVRQIKEYQLINSFANNKLNQLIRDIEPGSAGLEDLGLIEVSWKSMDQSVGDGVRQVMIIVEWQGRQGLKQYQLTTLIEGGSYD